VLVTCKEGKDNRYSLNLTVLVMCKEGEDISGNKINKYDY
jgi:hypothetical protein